MKKAARNFEGETSNCVRNICAITLAGQRAFSSEMLYFLWHGVK